MPSYLQLLEKHFPPPAPKDNTGPVDFSIFNLTQGPPADLVDLVEAYGPGKFHCGQGDGIELLPTVAASAELLIFAASHWLQVLDSDVLIDGDFTIPRTFFEVSNNKPPPNLILWGRSDNGVLLMSLWLSHDLGWCVLVMPESFNSIRSLFKSPGAVVWEAFFDSTHRDLFPASEEPYHFERFFGA